jgi:hypothetical protein
MNMHLNHSVDRLPTWRMSTDGHATTTTTKARVENGVSSRTASAGRGRALAPCDAEAVINNQSILLPCPFVSYTYAPFPKRLGGTYPTVAERTFSKQNVLGGTYLASVRMHEEWTADFGQRASEDGGDQNLHGAADPIIHT